MIKRSAPLVLGLTVGIAACGGADEEVILEFSSAVALEHTTVISVTAFEPILREPSAQTLTFAGCDAIGPFPPVRSLNPDAIDQSNLLRPALSDRESESYPLGGDWSVSFDRPELNEETNPWGAIAVYIEARGDARASEGGTGQVAATLLTGCYCVRTRDQGFSNPELAELDKVIRKKCPLLDEEGGAGERTVELKAVLPPEFHLEACEGINTITTPKNSVMLPGPQVCLRVARCDNVQTPQDCFDCESRRCAELDDMRHAPIAFTVEQPGGATTPLSQVILTDEQGRASGNIRVDDCSKPIVIAAQILGRPEETLRFDVSCVPPVTAFECTRETPLNGAFEAVAITTLPGEPGTCGPTTPHLCDQVAILYENSADGARLEVLNPNGGPAYVKSFPGKSAHAVHGFFYEPDTQGQPSLAIVLTSPTDGMQIYVYSWLDGELVGSTMSGEEGLLQGPCAWFDTCSSNSACVGDPDCSNMSESCTSGTCKLADDCWPKLLPQNRVSIETRDIDLDGKSDLVVGNNGVLQLVFFYSGLAGPDQLYGTDQCACGRFGQAPNAFTLTNIGGAVPDASTTDLVIGSAGGSFLKYANPIAGGSELTCGQSSPLGDGMSVRDVQAGTFACQPQSQSCVAYEDVVIVSARGISGGSLDEPGFIRVLFGSNNDLSVSGDVLDIPGITLGLVPSAITDRGEPRDPRTAQITDFNGDGHRDLAVLYKASEEIHVWLGASNRALGEVHGGVVLQNCMDNQLSDTCAPMPSFATPDLDGDGRSEIVVICEPMSAQARIRYFKTQAN